jgi:hypothetical protein
VVERADAEHGRERGRIDPRRNELAPRVGEGDEHDARDERDVERVLVEDPTQTRLLEDLHARIVPTLDSGGR